MQTNDSDFMFGLKKDLNDAFKNHLGKGLFSDLHLARVLAYTFVFGGGNEAVVYNANLNSSIRLAQDTFNIKGGEVPNVEGIKLFREAAKECVLGKATWIEKEICTRYNLKWSPDMYLQDISKYFSEFRKQGKRLPAHINEAAIQSLIALKLI